MSATIRAIPTTIITAMIRPMIAVCLVATGSLALAQSPSLQDVTALHWLPETAASARAHSVAAAIVLSHSATDPQSFGDRWQVERARLDGVITQPQLGSHASDGRWGYWVSLTQASDGSEIFDQPSPGRMSWTDVSGDIALNWPLWQAVVARQVPLIWGQRDDLDPYFGALLEAFTQASEADRAHARAQARRVERMHNARSETTRQTIEGSLLLAEAQFQWDRGEHLNSAWLVLEGLMWVADRSDQQNARFYAAWLASLPESAIRALRSTDINFPVIMALLIDSANHLSASPPERNAAQQKLASAYARLALFVSNPASYLDQPVRDQMRGLQADCGPGVDLTQQALLDCLARISETLMNDLASEELVGATGPLSMEFLARELDLVSWQRARYLDSYINWSLGGQCPAPTWVNALEWNLGSHWLLDLANRDVVDSAVAQKALWPPLLAQASDLSQANRQWLDCVTGMGGERQDLISRLLAIQVDELDRLEGHIEQASERFYSDVTRPGADINLDQPVSTPTTYRNQALRVGPCDASRACGSRVELPADEALLALVPDGYWLAEQLRLGEVSFCYDEVRWVDRMQAPARHNDSGVANYTGRLSFDFKAHFQPVESEQALILSRRLVSGERKDYFFGPADAENLAIDCPHGMEGQPIRSELSTNASDLVPDRLTYFTSVPTAASAYLLSQWPKWRARLADVSTDEDPLTELEVTHTPDDAVILIEAERARLALIDRRERALATRLANLEAAADDALAQSMEEVSIISRLLRRVMELHYSPIIRQDDGIRAGLAGDSGLLTREDIRISRDRGVPMAKIAAVGKERVRAFEGHWLQWPVAVREQGLWMPEFHWPEALMTAEVAAEAAAVAEPSGPPSARDER